MFAADVHDILPRYKFLAKKYPYFCIFPYTKMSLGFNLLN